MHLQTHTGDGRLAPSTMVDHFKVTHVLGRGGMGDVYLARDTLLGRRVALKLIRPEDLVDNEAKERFLFEARVTAQFSHPNIVTIYAVGEYAGQPYLALEYLDGQSLAARLRSGPLGTLEAARYGLAIAEALSEAHAHNILHRDLKAENVLLPKDGRLRVLDFGLARVVNPEAPIAEVRLPEERPSAPPLLASQRSERGEGGIVGTPGYMAPEQWLMDKVGPATDVFAFGVILFEMLEGRAPFRGSTWNQICQATCIDETPRIEAPQVSIEFKELVAWCLAKQPQDRPSMAEVAAVLSEVIAMGRGRGRIEDSPFRGLLPFTEAHAGSFFGRDEEVGAFVERLRDEPLLAVVGPSGAGKSSFVQAGVVPRLKEQGRWLAMVVRPGGAPFEALAAAIVRTESQIMEVAAGVSMVARSPESAAEEAGLAAELVSTPGRLGVRLEELAERQGVEVLLLVDQLEELVAQGAQDDVRQRFMEALSSAADDVYAPVRVVVTLRDDFLGKLAEGPAARRVLSQVVVLRSPGPSALAEIASRPLADVGYAYEDPQLPTVMAAAVQGEAASLPLLQFTLTALWKARDRSRKLIPMAAYTALGGVEGALAGHADGVMSGLSPVDLRAAREIFLRLVTPSRTRRAVPRDELLSGLPDSAAQVLDRLVQERALVARKGRAEGQGKLEIVHESLIRRWETLARWLDESREEHAFLTEAGQSAALWEKHGRRAHELWQGDTLRDGERLAARLNILPDDVRRFLAAGRNHARGRQRRLWFAVSFAFAFLVAVAVGLFVISREAERQRAAAEKQRVTAQEQRRQAIEQRTAAEQERAQALYAMAQALAEKAKELNVKAYHGSSAIYAAASLLNNPANPGSPHYMPDFARRLEAARDLVLDARSELYRAQVGRGLGRQSSFEASSEVKQIVFTPDGSQLLAGLVDGTIDTWEVASGKRLRETRIHSDAVVALAVSPDGTLAASVSATEGIHLWRPTTGELKGELIGREGDVKALAFTPDGTTLISGGKDNAIRLWDLKTRREKAVLRGHASEVMCLAISRSGLVLASGARDGALRLWDLPLGTPHGEWKAHSNAIWDVAFTADDKMLLTSSLDGTVRTWRAADMTILRRTDFRTGFVLSVRALGSGSLMVTMNTNDELVVTETGIGKDLLKVDQVEGARELRLATVPSSGLVAFPRDLNTIEVWRQLGPWRTRVLGVHSDRVVGFDWSSDGTLLASESMDKTLRIWDMRSGEERQVMRIESTFMYPLGFSPDADRLVTLSHDKTVRLWDPRQGTLVRSLVLADDTWGFGFSPDGKTLALNGGEGYLWLVDLASGKVTRRNDIKMPPNQSAYYASAQSLLIATTDNGFEIWDLDTAAHHDLALPGFCELTGFLPRKRQLTCADWTNKIFFVFDQEKEREVWRVAMPQTYEFANSANERFSFWYDNNMLIVISLDTGTLLMRLTSPGSRIAPSPDGRTFAFSSEGVVMTLPFEPEVLEGLGKDAVKELAEAEALAGKHLVGFTLEPMKN